MSNDLILEEYKIGWNVYYNSEKEYSNRENFFLAVLTLNAGITRINNDDFNIFFIILGALFSLIWLLMHIRSAALSKARLESLEEIENILNQSSTNQNKNEFGFLKRTRKKYCIINILGLNNWNLRQLLPILFLLFFCLMAIQLLYLQFC